MCCVPWGIDRGLSAVHPLGDGVWRCRITPRRRDTLSSCSAGEQVPKANEGTEQNEGLRLQKGNRRCLDSELEQRVVQELQQQEAVRQPSQPATQALA